MTEIESFVNEEMNKRGWTVTELARRSGLTHSAISQVLSGKNNPGPKFCNGIARALGIPASDVFRMAGLQPQLPEPQEKEEEMLFLFRQLDEARQVDVIAIARTFLNARRPGRG